VKGKTYKEINDGAIIRFNSDNTFLSSEHPGKTGSYYECGIGGFKASVGDEDYFGFKIKLENEGYGVVLQYSENYKIYSYQPY
jgi:hypothetical protein